MSYLLVKSGTLINSLILSIGDVSLYYHFRKYHSTLGNIPPIWENKSIYGN
ncbi:hypothetical protein MOUN0_L10176 [Monosporozyma unispora]